VVVYRVVFATKARARQRLIRWFDRYNQTRRHGHCGWRAPIAYEKITTRTRRAA
jgi:Integrase core domain